MEEAKALSYIVGTWNFMNESKGLTTSDILALEGNSPDQSFIQTINGKVIHGDGLPASSGSWYSNGHSLELSYVGGPGLWSTITTASPDRMTIVDVKGDVIHLVKNEIKPLLSSELVGTWNFVNSSSSDNKITTGKITFGPEGNKPISDTANFTETSFGTGGAMDIH